MDDQSLLALMHAVADAGQRILLVRRQRRSIAQFIGRVGAIAEPEPAIDNGRLVRNEHVTGAMAGVLERLVLLHFGTRGERLQREKTR